jgi:hypothetical protein
VSKIRAWLGKSRTKMFAWIDEWWAHRLHLPGGSLICRAFNRYLLAGEWKETDEQVARIGRPPER